MTDKLINFISFFLISQLVCFIAALCAGVTMTFSMAIHFFAVAVVISYVFDFLRIVLGDVATNIISKIVWILLIIILFPLGSLTLMSSIVMLILIALVFVTF